MVTARPLRALATADGLQEFWALLDAWQDYMAARGLSEETREQYESYLMRALRRARLTPEMLTPGALDHFVASVPPRGSNRAAYVSAFKSFCRFLYREQLVERDAASDLTTRPPKYPPPDHFTPAEARQIIDHARLHEARSPRRAAAITLLFETGARIGSLAAVERRDIRGDPPTHITFRKAKNDRPYEQRLTPAAAAAVVELLALMEPRQVTLVGCHKVTLGNWFHDAAVEAGFPPGRVHAHLARHTFATLLYRRTKDPVKVARALNHADLSQVMRYAREDEDDALGTSLTG